METPEIRDWIETSVAASVFGADLDTLTVDMAWIFSLSKREADSIIGQMLDDDRLIFDGSTNTIRLGECEEGRCSL